MEEIAYPSTVLPSTIIDFKAGLKAWMFGLEAIVETNGHLGVGPAGFVRADQGTPF